jgi:uncharacterized protein DUF4252
MLVRTLVLGASTLPLMACGITGNFRNDPGYADFSSFQRLEARSDFGLSLGPLPLQIAKWVLHDDEDVGPLIRELRAVRVYTFEGIADAEESAAGVKELTAHLTNDGWLNVVAVREKEETTSVFLRPGKDFTHRGLAVIVQEPSEVVLVNLIGNVRLDLINGYMAEVDVDVPPIEIDPETLQAFAVSRPASPASGIDP